MGVLLLTNDGELNQELSNQSKEVEKTYQVQLDRISYAGYQKKLPHGKWRFLTDNEIRRLKFLTRRKSTFYYSKAVEFGVL